MSLTTDKPELLSRDVMLVTYTDKPVLLSRDVMFVTYHRQARATK